MYYTLSIDGREQLIWPHDSLDAAERFAQDVANDGYNCMVLQVLSSVEGVQADETPEQSRGVVRGRDFPETLYGCASCLA